MSHGCVWLVEPGGKNVTRTCGTRLLNSANVSREVCVVHTSHNSTHALVSGDSWGLNQVLSMNPTKSNNVALEDQCDSVCLVRMDKYTFVGPQALVFSLQDALSQYTARAMTRCEHCRDAGLWAKLQQGASATSEAARIAWPTQRVQANDHLEWPAPAHAPTACQRMDVQHAWRSVANVGPSGQRAAAATQATHCPQLVALPCLCQVCASGQQRTKRDACMGEADELASTPKQS